MAEFVSLVRDKTGTGCSCGVKLSTSPCYANLQEFLWASYRLFMTYCDNTAFQFLLGFDDLTMLVGPSPKGKKNIIPEV